MVETRTRLSAGVIVVRFVDGEPRFLLLRIYLYWDFPKGEVGVGEDPRDAAVREVAEETGLVDLDFCWGRDYFETEPYSRGKVARYYLAESAAGEVTLGVSAELGRPEHHEYRWCTARQACTLLNERVRAALEWGLARVAGE